MAPPSPPEESTPFLLKVFYRTNAFHRPEEFTSPSLPPYVPIYTWKTCTLMQLAHLIAGASPNLLPNPAIGTRLVFRIIFADTCQSRPDSPPRYTVKDLGSVVIGLGGPGAGTEEGGSEVGSDEGSKTLNDAMFIVGDYISCAILPPLDLTGEIQPVSAARMGRGAGAGEGRGSMGALPPPRYGRGGAAGAMGDLVRGYGGRDPGRRGRGRSGGFPQGEWRRGEQLPDPPMGGRGPR
ncbi:hypothetical protein OQA88_449 [Cercophora sp. LCS_1]